MDFFKANQKIERKIKAQSEVFHFTVICKYEQARGYGRLCVRYPLVVWMCRACLSVSLNFMCSDYSAGPRLAACVAIMINSQMCTHYFVACSLVKRHFLCLLVLSPFHHFFLFRMDMNELQDLHTHTHAIGSNNKNKSSHAIQTTIKVRTFNRTWDVYSTQKLFFSLFSSHLLLSFTNFSTKCTFNYTIRAFKTLNSLATFLRKKTALAAI